MENPQISFEKLSPDQLAALDEEQKAIFASLDEKDQKFFADSFNPKDLPQALERKWEIMQRNQAQRERFERIKAQLAESAAKAGSSQPSGDLVTAAAAALGVGAAATLVATDNTAFYRGASPMDFLEPLRIEFQTERTALTHNANPDSLAVTISLLARGGSVPAMTIQLTRMKDGTEVKVHELNEQGIRETLRESGKKLLNIAGQGLTLLVRRRAGWRRPGDLISTADQVLENGSDLARELGNFKFKERAWKVLKQTAEALEAAYLDRLQKEKQERLLLEAAWDRYYNCPTCGVSFQSEDTACRVCGSGRPEAPQKPDPRQL